MTLASGPAVDFSRAGTECASDKDCVPTPDFDGVACECSPEGRCQEVKYLTNAEVYLVLLTLDGLFVFSPLACLRMLLGLTRHEAAQQILFGRSSSKATVVLIYGGMGLFPWIVYLATVVRW